MERQNILNFLEKTKTLILVHSEMQTVLPAKGMVNLMLTPQFYTLKREALPVKYAYQAKRIAPSLFEGLLENTEAYKYFVSKEDDTWLFIAYDEAKIRAFLLSKQIDLSRVGKIYFAEQSQKLFTSPVLMGEKEALVNIDDTITVVPQIVLSPEVEALTFNESFAPKSGISLQGGSHSFINDTQAYILAGILTLFAGMYIAEGVSYKGSGTLEKEEMQALLGQHPSFSSSYKRDSILSKYRKIEKKERKKRESIKALSRMNFKGSVLTSLVVNDKKFEAKFNCTDTSSVNRLKTLAKDAKLNVGTIKNNSLMIQGAL
jgi:hypothetical protein